MKKNTLILFLSLFFAVASADSVGASHHFDGKHGCFILYDLSNNKIILEYNRARCSKRISPDSTFKVALSLMVFDQKLITQKTVFKWDGENRGLALWNQNQTPYTWLKNSVVWVSQELTPQLGMSKIKWYLARFYYGNQDFSGDPGKYNGLTHAWLSSSLKISANEQLHFLKLLATNRLPVSLKAMGNTKTNMYLETSSNGWKLYGKTGAGDWVCRKDGVHNKSQDGWFIGYVKKKETIYLFVANITNFQKHEVAESDGTEVKNITKTILAQKGLF